MNTYQKLVKSAQNEIKHKLVALLKTEADRLLISRKPTSEKKAAEAVWHVACTLRWMVAQDYSKADAAYLTLLPKLDSLAAPQVRKARRVEEGHFLMANIGMEVTYQDQCGLNAVEFMALKNNGPMRWLHLAGTDVVKCKTVPFNGYQMKLSQLTDVIYDQ